MSDTTDTDEGPEFWLSKARRERDHVAKYPDCFDREERLMLAEQYERFARQERGLGEAVGCFLAMAGLFVVLVGGVWIATPQ